MTKSSSDTKDDGQAVKTTTEGNFFFRLEFFVVTLLIKISKFLVTTKAVVPANKPVSPFAKFRQLDRQNSQTKSTPR